MNIFLRSVHVTIVTVMLTGRLVAEDQPRADLSGVPGVVIDHLPAASGIYIGSPSIARLPSGDYVATHDEFGPKSTEYERAITRVFRSSDQGQSWQPIAIVDGQFWSTLFYHEPALYLLGTWKHHGNLIIRRSIDGGLTWSEPTDAVGGLLAEGQYHCAPQPVVVHNGKIYRAMEDAAGGERWGERYRPFMMSAPVDADLLLRQSWTFSNYVSGNSAWLDGKFHGWIEGNAVVSPEGQIVNILRVAGTEDVVGKAAIMQLSDKGQKIRFDAETGFIDFPGGCKKFTLRHDPQSGRYWSLVNWVRPEDVGKQKASSIRNTLALVSSNDLREWQIERVVIHHRDIDNGYQYVDWLFDGEDIVAVVRTAHDDGLGGAHNYHDANLMTFHRVKDFRNAPAGSRPQTFPIK
ncbi:MAG: sialidase family protein [Aeoliella sp.]